MRTDPVRNIAHSIHQRLLNKAQQSDRPFNELLQYYAIERLLYRLSRSEYGDRFVLKGALLIATREAPMFRPTRDIDLMGRVSNSLDSVTAIFKEVCIQDVESDGIQWDIDRLSAERIAEEGMYEGVRVLIHGLLGNARINLHIDIGFSDEIIPGPSRLKYPVILDLPAPLIMGYSLESVIAEKFETMVRRGEVNSRIKDFYDIWFLAKHFDFIGSILTKAVSTTFSNRGTSMPVEPVPLSSDMGQNEQKQKQWSAFRHRSRLKDGNEDFPSIIEEISVFLRPVVEAIVSGSQLDEQWQAPGPWLPG
ncbi:nucleotidyl transferase AbiEii/AbiGii toxin family protein [Gemmatimonadota bacterium]